MRFFNNLVKAFVSLGRRGQHNIVKILCLGVGLAVGSVLIAKVYFEQNYDTFFSNWDRTYIISEKAFQNGKLQLYPQTSGAVAPGVKRYAPQVEAATRYTGIADECNCETQDKKKIKANIALVDSCFFDIVDRPIIQGNPKEALSRPFYCMINRKLAATLGNNVIGKELVLKDMDNLHIIIGGVYEDIPLNSGMKDLNILVAMSTLRKVSKFDGSNNWVGNDRYIGLIRLAKGCKIEDISRSVEKMRQENLPLKEMKRAGVDLNYMFTPLNKMHTSDPAVKKMSWILSLLAFILIFSAVMNYLLIVIGNIVSRAKEMAVRKCYGAKGNNIHSIIFSETLVHLIMSILLAACLIIACRGMIEKLLDASLMTLLFNKGSWILLAVCIVILFVGGLVPGFLYSSIPVATAFRRYNESRRRWKLLLLSIQFVAAGFLVSLLFVINKQYSLMINDNPGYHYENLATVNMVGIKPEQCTKTIEELKKLASVESVTSADYLPNNHLSGNNISLPGDDREYMNIADLYSVSDGYLKTMGIKIVQGKSFTEQTDSMREIMVCKSFVDKMRLLAHWDNNAIGRRILISEHSQSSTATYTICGVYDNIRIGSISMPDDRSSVMFYSKQACPNILIKFHNLTSDNMKEAQQLIQKLNPDNEIYLISYKSTMQTMYQPQYNFREAVLIGGVVTLIIALLGLVGYTNDEVVRRQKEIAIRKVNGAEVKDILHLFIKDILRIAVPSLIVSGVGALIVARKWLEQFSDKAHLSFFLFLGSGLLVLGIIIVAVAINCYKVANGNPVEYIKGE